MAQSRATAQFHQAQAGLALLAQRELLALWQGLDLSDPIAVRVALEEFLPQLVQAYGEVGAAVAADFYDEIRAAAEVRSVYSATLPEEVVRVEQVRASARWAIGPLFSGAPDVEVAQSNVLGITKRLVLTPARATVRENTLRDPDAVGWRRVGDGDSCKFCRMLIGRGEVYSKETARFGAHDNCGCLAEPAYGGEPAKVHQYAATKRQPSEKDRERVRDFLARMPDAPEPGERRVPDIRSV